MIKIGDLLLLQTHTLLVPKEQTVSMELRFDEDDHVDPLILFLSFVEDEVNEESKGYPKSELEVGGEEKKVIIKFLNWNKPFGSSIQEPILFAVTSDEHEIYIMANARSSGDIYELTVQFLKGGV